MTKINVGVVSSYPDPLCGISTHTGNILNYLRNLVDITLLQPISEPLSINYKSVQFWNPTKIEELPGDLDIIWIQHEHGLNLPLNMIANACRIRDIPIVITLHQVVEGDNNYQTTKAVTHFPKFDNKKDIRYIPHGCRDLTFRISKKQSKKLLNMPEDKKVFVMPGRLETRKELDILVKRFNDIPEAEFYFVGSIPHTNFWQFKRWMHALKSITLEHVHIVSAEPVPQYILDLYCQAADFLIFNNMQSFYSISGAAQAAWEFNKVALSPKNVMLFEELTDKNSLKFYNMDHLSDLIKNIGKEEDYLDKKLRLMEEFENKKFQIVAQKYANLFVEIIAEYKK